MKAADGFIRISRRKERVDSARKQACRNWRTWRTIRVTAATSSLCAPLDHFNSQPRTPSSGGDASQTEASHTKPAKPKPVKPVLWQSSSSGSSIASSVHSAQGVRRYGFFSAPLRDFDSDAPSCHLSGYFFMIRDGGDSEILFGFDVITAKEYIRVGCMIAFIRTRSPVGWLGG